MDRLIKPDVKAMDIFFIRGKKCTHLFNLTNLMHTMPVAISLTSSNPTEFSFSQEFAIIQPLATASFTLITNKALLNPPIYLPRDTVLVRSSPLPTGKAKQGELHRRFSKPGRHIVNDATLPVRFVGPHVAEFVLSSSSSSSSKKLEICILFSRAISVCDRNQLTDLLRTAVADGKVHFVSSLIDAGADVDDRDADDSLGYL